MKTLVTGATGFLGSHVVRQLIDEGHSVRILRRPASRMELLSGLHYEEAIGDVTHRDAVFQAVEGCDGVFHVAGLLSFWWKANKGLYDVNVRGTRNIVDACLTKGVKRLIHTSSIVTLGTAPAGEVTTEATVYNGHQYDIPYFDTKYRGELEVQKAVDRGLDAVIINPGTIIGPGDINMNFGRLIYLMAKGGVPFYTAGSTTFCDVEDVARGHVLALDKGRAGERYIMGGQNVDWKTLLEVIADVVGVAAPRQQVPAWVLHAYAYGKSVLSLLSGKEPHPSPAMARAILIESKFSSDKAIKELGYQVTPLKKTIQKTHEWYLNHGYL